jgi:hypothetical protein
MHLQGRLPSSAVPSPATLGGDSSAVPYPGHAGRRFIRQFALPLKITSFIIIGTLICKCAHAILSSFAGILLINRIKMQLHYVSIDAILLL